MNAALMILLVFDGDSSRGSIQIAAASYFHPGARVASWFHPGAAEAHWFHPGVVAVQGDDDL